MDASRFRTYPAYKDSGAGWLGMIPAHWEVKRLKYAAHIGAGQSPSSKAVTAGFEGLPFLQGNAEFGAFHPHLILFAMRLPSERWPVTSCYRCARPLAP